jgi:hypothetical protein
MSLKSGVSAVAVFVICCGLAIVLLSIANDRAPVPQRRELPTIEPSPKPETSAPSSPLGPTDAHDYGSGPLQPYNGDEIVDFVRSHPIRYDLPYTSFRQITAPVVQYAELTNPPPDTKNKFCLGDKVNWDKIHMVVTTSRTLSAAWIDEVPYLKVLYSKHFGMDHRWHDAIKAPVDRTWRSPWRNHTFQTPVLHRESINVGDESLSVFSYLYEFYDHLPELVVVNHWHRESWHSMDVVPQLNGMCIDMDNEHYRTLTHINRGFFMHCLPRNESLRAVLQPRNIDSSFAEPYSTLWKQHLEEFIGPQPEGFPHHCCSSFVVTRKAVLRRPRRFYYNMIQLLQNQPRNHATVIPNDKGKELGYIFERLWGPIFGMTRTDFYRDFTNTH